MARNNDRDRGPKRGPKEDKRRITKKKPAPVAQGTFIDYRDINLLRKFMSDRGKIRARRVTGLTVQTQRDIAEAIKIARELALLPYATRAVSEGRRGPRRDRGPRPGEEAEVTEMPEYEVEDDGADDDGEEG